MSRVSVTQFITDDGKIQIDVTNTSGRPQSRPHGATFSGANADRMSEVRDQDEPCSLIVSLRSSHPQFFFFRGPQSKPATSVTVASPLRLLNGGGGGGGNGGASGNSSGVGGGGGGGGRHRRVGSALWGHEVIDPAILDVSRQTWREHNFSPVAPASVDAAAHASADRSNDLSTTALPPASAHATSDSDSRPLLVREEVADCVLLPGERRTFFIEVSNPSVLAKLLSPKKTPSSVVRHTPLQPRQLMRRDDDDDDDWERRSGPGDRRPVSRLPPVLSVKENNSNNSESPHAPVRVVTDVFHMDHNGHGVSGQSSAARRNGSGIRGPLPESSSLYSDGPYGSNSGYERAGATAAPPPLPPSSSSVPRGRPQQQPQQRRQYDWENEESDTEDANRSPSRQPLSIVAESSTTRASLPNESQPRQRGNGVPDSLRSSRDYVVPPSSSTSNSDTVNNSSSTPHPQQQPPVNGSGLRPTHHTAVPAGGSHGESPLPARSKVGSSIHSEQPSYEAGGSYAPPSLSQRPVFFVYYHPLGDENKCVDRARKWLAKEQHTYHEWREAVVQTVVEHERRRERTWTVKNGQGGGGAGVVVPPLPRLEVKRILPPVLGELVRWRDDNGSSGCESDPMEPSPVTVAAFHYYFAQLSSSSSSGGVDGPLGGGSSHRRGLPSASARHGGVDVPPSFASTRANRVSKKARKMFKGDRQGAGTVVMPLRVQDSKTPTPHSNHGTRQNSGNYSADPSNRVSPSPSKLTQPNYSQSQLSQQSRQQQQQQQQTSTRGVSQRSGNSESPLMCSTPAPSGLMQSYRSLQPSRLNDDDDDDPYNRSTTTMSEGAPRDSYSRRPRFRTGRGLALLDDSMTGPPTPSAGYAGEPVGSSGDFMSSQTESRQSFLANSNSNSTSRWGRTNTLDPAAAELAARNPVPPRTSASEGGALHHTDLAFSPSDARPSLPSFPSTLDNPRGVGGGAGSGERSVHGTDYLATPFTSTARRLAHSGSSSHLNTQALEDGIGPGSAAAGSSSTTMPGGSMQESVNDGEAEMTTGGHTSFVANLIQSFCGGGRDTRADNASLTDADGASPHVRDISSAPPQRVTYRRRNASFAGGSAGLLGSGGGSNSFTGSPSFSLTHSPSGRWLADQSKVATTQVRVAAQQFSEKAGAAAVQAADLLQQHGPTALEGLMTALNFVKDVVFTPENVTMMETVITPMVIVFSVIALAYIMLFGGGGAEEAFPLLYSGSL